MCELICHVDCLYVSVTNTKAYVTLVTEHIYFGHLMLYIYEYFLSDVIFVNVVNVIIL